MFLYSLACNVELEPKSIFRSELIKVPCSCIPWLVIWNLAKSNFQERTDKGSMFLHSLACYVEYCKKSIFRSKVIKVRCSCILWLVVLNLVRNQFLERTDNGSMFLHSLACNVELFPKSIFKNQLIKVRCSCIPWLIMKNLANN